MAKRTDSKVDRKRKLEELKRQQRSKERRKTILTLGTASVIGLALLGGVIGAAVAENRKEERAKKKAAAEAQAKIDAAKAELKTIGVPAAQASCTPPTTDNPIPTGKHVQGEVQYPSAPPTGGDHSQQTLPIEGQNFYERDSAGQLVEQAVHDLEHGVIVAWYDSKLAAAEVDVLKKIAANALTQMSANLPGERPKNRLLVMPWDRGNFADDKHFVLTAWGHKQACGKVSGEAVQTFMEQFENKDAPEPGFPLPG